MKNNSIGTITSPLLLSLSLYTGCANKTPDIYIYPVSYNKQKVISILEQENINQENINQENINQENINQENNFLDNPKIKRSIFLVGQIEFDFFIKQFDIKNIDDFSRIILKLQSEANIEKDAILGGKTLKYLYLNYYSKLDKKELSFDIQNRLDIYYDMLEYPDKSKNVVNIGKVKPTNVPNIFLKDYYYGEYNGENISGTYLNKDLLAYVSQNIENKTNYALVKKINNKFVVSVYINGELKLLSYVSPGNEEIAGGVKTGLGQYVGKHNEKYYISGAKDSIKKAKNGIYYGAIMPYAVHINKGIYAHAGMVNGDRRSHGCIRLPIFYAKGLYEIFSDIKTLNWEIIDN